MGYILLSDVHFTLDQPEGRLDNAFDTLIRKLTYVLDYARKNNYNILQAGDFFNSPRNWRSLSALINILLDYQDIYVYCVAGQHDLYLYNQESFSSTAMGILTDLGLLTLLNNDPIEMNNSLLWGASFGQDLPKVTQFQNKQNILVIHQPILMSKLWKGQRDVNYAPQFLMDHPEFDLILCGDIHNRFIFVDNNKRIICNSGPLLRREASLDMLEHRPGFYVYQPLSKNIFWEEIPHETADKVLSREHIDSTKDLNDKMDKFIELIREEKAVNVSFKENLEVFLTKTDIIEKEEIRRIIAKLMEKRK